MEQAYKHSLFLILWILLLHAPSQAQQIDAWLIVHDGAVFTKKQNNTSWHPFETQISLSIGDSVRTGPSGRAILLYRKGELVTLGARESYGIVAAHDTAAPSVLVETLEWAFAREDPEELDMLRGTEEDPPVLLYPRKGYVLSQTPPFAWLPAIPRDASYSVRVVKDLSEIVCQMDGINLWELVIPDTTLQYPVDEAPLERGQRYWVEIEREEKEIFDDAGCFTVATEEEFERHNRALHDIRSHYGDHPVETSVEYSFALYLIRNDYFTDALLFLQVAETKQAGAPWIQRLRNWIYEEAGPPFLIVALD